MITTHALNDVDAAMADKLRHFGLEWADEDTPRRILNELIRDDRFVHMLTSAIHEAIGSPFDKGMLESRSCGDYAESVVRQFLWRA